MSFSGLQGLTAVSLTSSAVVGGDATNGLHMQVGTSINNPSTITLQLNADVTLNVFANGNQIGTVKLANFALAPNANSFSADAFLNTNTNNAAATSALQSAMSSYLGGSPTSLTLQGSAASIPYASLQPAFAALAISTTLAGQTSKLLVSGKMVPDLTSTSILATTIVVSNPLAAPITIQKITASVLFGNTKIGSIDFALDTPTTVAAGGSSTTEKIPLNLVISTTDLIALLGTGLKLLSGNLNVNIASTIQNALGSFDNTIQYNQNNVPIAFALA
ncbi:hypothetical protein HDU83_009759 [Entophlyctis luteolus]|nr:hypothetical protein HDU83_009759 [Entophlyctis luteolus]